MLGNTLAQLMEEFGLWGLATMIPLVASTVLSSLGTGTDRSSSEYMVVSSALYGDELRGHLSPSPSCANSPTLHVHLDGFHVFAQTVDTWPQSQVADLGESRATSPVPPDAELAARSGLLAMMLMMLARGRTMVCRSTGKGRGREGRTLMSQLLYVAKA